MQQSKITDEDIVQRLKNGDIKISEVLYERYRGSLYIFCLGLLKDKDVSRDIVQQTFFTFLTEYRSIKEPKSLKSWLFTIARNEALAHFKRKRKTQGFDGNERNIFSDESMLIESTERIEIVRTLIDKLLPQYKEVLFLREYQMMKYEEIAVVTGTTVSAVKSKLFKARMALQEKLRPYIEERAL